MGCQGSGNIGKMLLDCTGLCSVEICAGFGGFGEIGCFACPKIVGFRGVAGGSFAL